MFRTLNGTETFSGALAVLLARTIQSMFRPSENLYRYQCDNKVEFGVPLFDDLDPRAKAKLLSETARAFFDPKSGPLDENAYTAATIHAVCRHLRELLETEFRAWHKAEKKNTKDSAFMRILILAAFQERFPGHPFSPGADSDDLDMFRKMVRRLAAEIAPEPFFLMAGLEPTKRNELSRRMGVSDDYFSETAVAVPESRDPDEYIGTNRREVTVLCHSATKQWFHRFVGLEREFSCPGTGQRDNRL